MGLSDLWGGGSKTPDAAQWGGHQGGAQSDWSDLNANAWGSQKRDAYHMDPNSWAAQQGRYDQETGMTDQSRGGQQRALQMMEDAASGLAPSAAEMQMKRGIDSGVEAQMAMANSARGGANAMAGAQRQAAFSGAQQQQAGIGQAAQMRAQEMATAREGMANAANALRSSDMQSRMASLQALGMSQEMAYRQAGLEMQQRGMNDQMTMGLSQQAQGVRHGQLGADMQHAGLQNSNNQFNATQNTNAFNGLMGAGAAAATGGGSLLAGAATNAAAGDNQGMLTNGAGLGFGSDIRGKWDITSDAHAKTAAYNAGAQAGARRALADVAPAPAVPAAIRQWVAERSSAPPAVAVPPGLRQWMSAPSAGAMTPLDADYPNATPARVEYAPATSDERAKHGAGGATTEADNFLSTLTPHSYRYKNPADEPSSAPNGGRYLGVMAQNVERGPTGDTIVHEDERGMKRLEGGSLMSALAAGAGRLHERVSALEGRGR